VLEISGQANMARSLHTHCQREVLHAQLRVILDDDFMHAYEHGIEVYIEKVWRRFYIRILTYSADYPEK
jgi:hypothetical protein